MFVCKSKIVSFTVIGRGAVLLDRGAAFYLYCELCIVDTVGILINHDSQVGRLRVHHIRGFAVNPPRWRAPMLGGVRSERLAHGNTADARWVVLPGRRPVTPSLA